MKNKLMNVIFIKINNCYDNFNSQIIKRNTKTLLEMLNYLSTKRKDNGWVTKLIINNKYK